MQSKVKFLVFITMLLSINSGCLAQDYLSKLVPLDFYPNPRNLLYENGKYIVPSINFIDGISTSTIIELDINFDTIQTVNYFEVLFGRKAMQKYGGKYYVYGADETTNRQTHLLVVMDSDFKEIKRDTFYPDGLTHNANGMTMVGDKIIGGAWDYYDCPELNECTYMNYKVISTEGEELQSINVDEEGEPYFFSFEVDHTQDGDIICGGNRYELPFTKASVYRTSQEGQILWKYESPHRQSRGNVPAWIEELSDGNIVFTDKLDKGDDDEYLEQLFTDRPAELVWLSPDGDFIHSYLDTLNWTSSSEFLGVKRGRGDYFFAYGFQRIGNLEPTEFDGNYAFLMKIRNNGEIVWRRLYRNSNHPNTSAGIRYIYEHENGDISTLGAETSQEWNGTLMWMMRVNENGCLGDDGCDDPLILPVDEVDNFNPSSLISVFPNPTTGFLTLSSMSDIKINQFSVYDINGQLLLSNELNRTEDQIDLSELKKGIYISRILLDDHNTIYKRIVKN